MATIAFFHAHPDDESTSTGGTIALLADQGHDVIVITATDGAEGEVEDGFLGDDETLSAVRAAELLVATDILGAAEVVMLGYADSGMMGTPENENPECFWKVDVEAAATDLAGRLAVLNVEVLVVYDSNGGYGHPDHIQVHRVGRRAAEIAGIERVYEATFNRDMVKELRELNALDEEEEADSGVDIETMGTPFADITTVVDVSSVIDRKRRAMLAHESQVPPDSWFFNIPGPGFEGMFGNEWFLRVVPPFDGTERETSLV